MAEQLKAPDVKKIDTYRINQLDGGLVRKGEDGRLFRVECVGDGNARRFTLAPILADGVISAEVVELTANEATAKVDLLDERNLTVKIKKAKR